MAAVTVTAGNYVTPTAYEVNDKGVLTQAVTAGAELVLSPAGWSLAPITGITEAHGLAIQDGYAGQGNFPVMIQGEMDGYTGLNAGDPLYPSTSVAGGLDTTPITNATVRVRAVTATRVRVNYV